MKPTTLSELKASNYIEAAPNGIRGRFRKIDNRWVHVNAIAFGQVSNCAKYTDEEMFERSGKDLRILPSSK